MSYSLGIFSSPDFIKVAKVTLIYLTPGPNDVFVFFQTGTQIGTNKFCALGKYIFSIFTNVLVNLENYNLQYLEMYFDILTNRFVNLKKCIW